MTVHYATARDLLTKCGMDIRFRTTATTVPHVDCKRCLSSLVAYPPKGKTQTAQAPKQETPE